MPGKFLNLSFHGGTLTAEDLRFKEEARKLTSALKTTDAMDEPAARQFFDDNAGLLLATKEKFSGVGVSERNGIEVTTLNGLGPPAWARKGYVPQVPHRLSVFEQWMEKVLATPVDVLVVAGHHRDSEVWGAAPLHTYDYFAGFFPHRRLDNVWRLQIRGHAAKKGEFVRAAFDIGATLASCRLMILLGCNGANTDVARWRRMLMNARGGTAPHIFGWYGVHGYPHEGEKHFLSAKLWPALEALAPGAGAAKSFDFLDEPTFRVKVRTLWRDVLRDSFPAGSLRRHLFYDSKTAKGGRGPRGGGVVDPEGRMWWIDDKGELADAGEVS